jgi:glycerophosphoryl diester phosphodiesterase
MPVWPALSTVHIVLQSRLRGRLAAVAAAGVVAVAAAGVGVVAPGLTAAADDGVHGPAPRLTGRAVLPVETYAPGPPAGAGLVTPANGGVINGIHFPTPSQPVEGFSGIVAGERDGEYLAIADNGFGNKANSFDFHIRAYVLRPDFKTADGGMGAIGVGPFIEFSDPWQHIGFPIRNETGSRVLTGADLDPESIQRGPHGDLWVGDEFGPWLLHFDADGRLLEAPYPLPEGLVAATNPLSSGPVRVNNSRGIEAMAMTPNGRYLYVVLEGAVIGDPVGSRRVYEFDIHRGEFTARMADYHVELEGNGTDAHFVADAQALEDRRLLILERDGFVARFRRVYEVDLREVGADGSLTKREVVDLAAIPDPDGVSLPPIHTGDVGLGDPFRVMCESIEALYVLPGRDLLLGCDNNFPNTGRNPNLADDNELIVVDVPEAVGGSGR